MALAIWLVGLGGKAHATDDKEMERLLDAISRVESRRDPNAVGDHGRAIGAYQIHRRYWEDGTRILGVDWKYCEASDPEKARQVVRAYLSYYGRGKSLLDMARIHNGGPRGHRLKATQKYALKIAAIMAASQSS
ncbi:MAG TPA: transglycosylase SLT domain-containing protein [Sedimentisphaerales bacterium]|jgi:soluble lytic murein transglycosylase-like protein|nr:transglycosylase SLT domain-containing protein [Sedimentisphaerales bacterium]HNU30355.1 transglycosylase SLT domain-containing protein [Sedimentisphaerales bacterium]